jgi:hypothetical protein
MDDETFEIICTGCRSSVPSTTDVCPSCGYVLFVRDPPPDVQVGAAAAVRPHKPRRRLFGRHRPA